MRVDVGEGKAKRNLFNAPSAIHFGLIILCKMCKRRRKDRGIDEIVTTTTATILEEKTGHEKFFPSAGWSDAFI